MPRVGQVRMLLVVLLIASGGAGVQGPLGRAQLPRPSMLGARLQRLYLPLIVKPHGGDALDNGGFESGDLTGWRHGGSLQRRVATGDVHGGQYAAVLGHPEAPPCDAPSGEAWIEQEFTVPAKAAASLSLWYRLFTYDRNPGLADTIDHFDVWLNGERILRDVNQTLAATCEGPPHDLGWQQVQYDLSAHSGSAVTLRVELTSTDRWWNSWVWIDDVEVLEASLGPSPTPTATVTSTHTPTLTPTLSPTPHDALQYVDEQAGIRFWYPSRFSLDPSPGEDDLARLTHGLAVIRIPRRVVYGYPIQDYTDSVVSFFCGSYPPCQVLEREQATLGGEPGERIAIQYTDQGEEWVRFSVSANHDIYRFGVWLFTPRSEFAQYREDAETIMQSLQFLGTEPRTPTPTEVAPGIGEYSDQTAGVRFRYTTRFALFPNPAQDYLATLRHGRATIDIPRREGHGTPIQDYTDSVVSFFCTTYPPCEVLEREEATLGGEPGERIAIRYTDEGEERVRFSISANHGIYRFGVWLFTPLGEFPEYRGDAESIMDSFEFLDGSP